jgi:hypothetical protein
VDADPYAASVDNLLSFLATKSQECGVSRVYCLLSAVAHHYRLKGLPALSDDTRIKMFMKGLKRINAKEKTVKRSRPMTLEILEEAASLLVDHEDLRTWRTVWRMHVSFFCFLRWDDLKRLTKGDVTHDSNEEGPFYILHLKYGKSNQLNQPTSRIVTSTGGISCPYALTKRQWH